MKKAEFVSLIAECGLYSKKDAEVAMDAVFDALEKALANGEYVDILGFGKFEVVVQKGKEGKVPGTDKTYKTKDRKVAKFKAGKNLKEKVALLKI